MAIVALALEHGAQSSPSCRLLGERDGRAWSFDETLIPEIKPAPRVRIALYHEFSVSLDATTRLDSESYKYPNQFTGAVHYSLLIVGLCG